MNYRLGLLLISSIIFNACEDGLDRDVVTTLNEKQVQENFDYSQALVTSIYSDLPSGLLYLDGAMMASAGDEAEHTLETSLIQQFNTGSWNAYLNPDDVWGRYYSGIRKVNMFLLSADSINLDHYRLDPSPVQQFLYSLKLKEIDQWKYETRLLRAFFYFELVKRYGGVPIITDPMTIEDDFNLERNSLEECFQFISDECDSAANNLPDNYAGPDIGRVTSGTALALKSRVLLYSASELFNSTSLAGGYSDPALISHEAGNRIDRWKAAADAAKAVIDLNRYSLSNSYSELFGPGNYRNSEVIFERRHGSSNEFERATYPVGYDLGESGTTPSQNLVDAYEILIDSTTSEKFDWNNPDHASSPYLNRDPRLNYTILSNDQMFKHRNVEIWKGGLDGKGIEMATKTGYYLRKYVNEELNLLIGQTSVHSWILIRLAEIYLNYAEALNEYNPGHPDIKIYVDMVRQREGVNMPLLPDNLSQDEMREKIRHERRIELAFEDHRFWDVRRWMIAEQALNSDLEGVDIVRNPDGTFNYEKITVEKRIFEQRMYFYPIPMSELLISNELIQNPLW